MSLRALLAAAIVAVACAAGCCWCHRGCGCHRYYDPVAVPPPPPR
jgi:hypothetical protein